MKFGNSMTGSLFYCLTGDQEDDESCELTDHVIFCKQDYDEYFGIIGNVQGHDWEKVTYREIQTL